MNKKQPDDPIILKQKIIYFQSELSRYKAKMKDYEQSYHFKQMDQLKAENAQLKLDLDEVDQTIKQLMKQMEDLQEENVILQEQVSRSVQMNETVQQKEVEIKELCEKLTEAHEQIVQKEKEMNELKNSGGLRSSDSWFANNLKQQSVMRKQVAIPKQQIVRKQSEVEHTKSLFSFSDSKEEDNKKE